MAQISEFSLILGALGLSLGHITAETMGLITLVGLITIRASTYLILYSHPLYKWLSPWLTIFERNHTYRETEPNLIIKEAVPQVILFGLGRYGSCIAQALRDQGNHVLTVDFNPDLITSGGTRGHVALFGDAEDPEFIASLPLANTQWVVSTARDNHTNMSLIHSLQNLAYTGKIAVTAHHRTEVTAFEQAGADLVLVPFSDAALEAAERIIEHDSLVNIR